MSVTPTFSLKLIKDFDFKEKFNLTDTQTDVMAYFVNLSSWAYTDGNGYYLALTSKIMNDLGLGLKTVEASILKLKKLNLISTRQMEVKEWLTGIKHRYVTITAKGRTYDNAYFPPKESQKLNDLESQNRELREKIKTMEMAVLTEKELLKERNEAKENREEETTTQPTKFKSSTLAFQTIEILKASITRRYKKNQKPICNQVDGWLAKTEFYINNYGNLAVLTPEKDFKQVDGISDVNQFWEWLFNHQDSIGITKKIPKRPNISSLLKFIGEKFKLNDEILYTLKEIIPKEEGIILYFIHPNEGLLRLTSNRINKLYTVQECLKILTSKLIMR